MVMDDEGGPPAAATRSASKNRAGGSKDDHGEDRSVISDDSDASPLAARMARLQKKGVHGEGSSTGGKRAVRGEGSSAGRDRAGDVDDKDDDADQKTAGGGLTSGKPGGSLTSGKPVVFPARVFATRVNYKDMVYKGGAEIDDKLNMELRPNFHTAPFSATLFADLPRLAQLAVLSLGWNAINWDADSFKPKIDYSSTGSVIMSSEMRELIKMSYPNLKEDEGRLLHAYLIKRVLGYSPFTWPGPNDKFGEFGEDINMICEVLERVWLCAANESSDILPGLTNENEVGDLKLAFEDPLDDNDDDDNGRRLYFLDHFYSEIVDKILFKAGASRRPLRLSAQNEEHLYNWARSTVTTVIREVQDVVHVAAQDLDEAEAAIVDRLKGDRVHETTRKGTTVQILGLRHEEQRNALQSVARDQKNIHSLMLLDDRDYLVWMAGGAVFRVPSLQINSMFTAVFVEKLRQNPNRKFCVPIGNRSTLSAIRLPTEFVALPTEFLSTKSSKTCVGLAIALGLHALGDVENAAVAKRHAPLAVSAVEANRSSNELSYFAALFTDELARLYTVRKLGTLTCEGLLTLARSSPQVIRIINAVASDGCCGHAFCIYNNLIFDSAEKRAMPLEQQWLDRCVRADARDSATFSCVREALFFEPLPRLLDGIKKRRLQEASVKQKRAKL